MMAGEGPLQSWKEISAYLHSSRRTCQRWEKELDLPVHRLDGTPKARVFAHRAELDAWLAGKLNHVDITEERRQAAHSYSHRWGLVFLGGLCALVAGALVASQTFLRPWLSPPENKPTLAVLPLENATGDSSWEDWKTALPDLIITDLLQSRFVNVARVTDIYRSLVTIGLGEADRFTDDDLRRIVERAGIDHVATGIIRREDGEIVADITLIRPGSGEVSRSVQAVLHGEAGVFQAADSLSRGLKGLLLPVRKYVSRDVDRDVRKVSTSSAEAFKLFSQGYRLFGINKLQESISLMQKAVELDPEFALAYKYLWRSCMNARREEDESVYMKKAVDLSSRLSERERGDLRVLFFRNQEKDPSREKAALERLWRYHPDDRFGGIQLMSSLISREEWAEALPVVKLGLAANVKEYLFIRGVVLCQANLGRVSEAEQSVSAFIASNPDHPYWKDILRLRLHCRILQGDFEGALADLGILTQRFPNDAPITGIISRVHVLRGDFKTAETEVAKLLASEDAAAKVEALWLTGDIRLFQGRIEDAKRAFRQGLEITSWTEANAYLKPRFQAGMHGELGYLHRITGDLDEALKETEAAIQMASSGPGPPSVPFQLLGLRARLLLEMNRPGDFTRQVEAIREALERQSNPKEMRIWHHLIGLEELKKNNVRKAIPHLWRAIDLLSIPGKDLQGAYPEYFYALAEAYARLGKGGDIRRALAMYEKVIEPTTFRIDSGDLYTLSFYKIAALYDLLSSDTYFSDDEIRTFKSKAIGGYRTFLELWKDADPIFGPEIEDARRRLAGLGSD